MNELVSAARYFDTLRDVKVVVVAGNGRAFSAGADLASFAATDTSATAARDAADAGRRMAEAIEAMNAVTVAGIHGHCVGGGVALASACDLRIAADDTRFRSPKSTWGYRLPGAESPGWCARSVRPGPRNS